MSSASAQKSWSLYNVLILIRICVAPLLTGYVHPDEFFQGGQELWFGCPPTKPWEFESNNALRSVVPPTIMTWLPLRLCSTILGVSIDHLPGWYVWVIPRVACAIASILAVDCSVWVLSSRPKLDNKEALSKASPEGVPTPVLLIASAWPTMVLLNRPFTNAMETWILALLFRVVLQEGPFGSKATISIFQCLAVGILMALGIFTRFTFVCFAFPLAAFFGLKMIKQIGVCPFAVIAKVTITIAAFVLMAAFIMDRDKDFYASPSLVLTPWNAFSYNSKVENLQHHGLHPRYTHALVNMFLLYGPMVLIAYVNLGMTAISLIAGPRIVDSHERDSRITLTTCCQLTILCGLGLLSSAPHQEPRFLLPLLVPLVLFSVHTKSWERYQHHFVSGWIVFNGILLLLFGIMHQAGVIPSLLETGSTLMERNPKAMIFYHTYMPPTFISRSGVDQRKCNTLDGVSCDPCKDYSILDLNGSHNMTSLRATIAEQLPCIDDSNHVTLVASPLRATVDGQHWYFGAERCIIPGYACKRIWSHSPHLSTEDFPSLDQLIQEGLPLSIYEISCS